VSRDGSPASCWSVPWKEKERPVGGGNTSPAQVSEADKVGRKHRDVTGDEEGACRRKSRNDRKSKVYT